MKVESVPLQYVDIKKEKVSNRKKKIYNSCKISEMSTNLDFFTTNNLVLMDGRKLALVESRKGDSLWISLLRPKSQKKKKKRGLLFPYTS